MSAAAALLWRRLAMSGAVARPSPPRLAPGPSWMGTAAAVRKTDGGRRPEATRRVTAIRLELGDRHLPDKARQAFVFEGHSYAFARQVAVTEAAGGRTARVRTNGSAQTCDLRYFGTPTSVGRRQHHSWVLSLRANRLLDHTKLSQRDRGRVRREGSAASPNRNRYSGEARNYRIKDAQCDYSAIAATRRSFGARL
jgi:hypothetical protein